MTRHLASLSICILAATAACDEDPIPRAEARQALHAIACDFLFCGVPNPEQYTGACLQALWEQECPDGCPGDMTDAEVDSYTACAVALQEVADTCPDFRPVPVVCESLFGF